MASSIIAPQFCAPYAIDLIITKKPLSFSDCDYVVSDAHGTVVLKVKGKAFSLRDRRVLEDASGNILISFQPKVFTWHSTWRAFRGKSSRSRDLLFTVKRSSVFQWKTKLDVFLATNAAEKRRDFKVKGNFWQDKCTVYNGGSSEILAKMEEKTSIKNQLLGKDTYRISVARNMDYAFVIALIMMNIEIDKVPDVPDSN